MGFSGADLGKFKAMGRVSPGSMAKRGASLPHSAMASGVSIKNCWGMEARMRAFLY